MATSCVQVLIESFFLQLLYMSNNSVKDAAEFKKLADLPCLIDLLFEGIYSILNAYRLLSFFMSRILERLSNLRGSHQPGDLARALFDYIFHGLWLQDSSRGVKSSPIPQFYLERVLQKFIIWYFPIK